MSKKICGADGLVVCGILAGLLFAGCATNNQKPPPPPVTVAEIAQMSGSGVPMFDIIAKIRASGTVYRMKASELAKLKQQGVGDDVIDYMQETYLHAIERDTQLRDSNYWTRWDDGYLYGGMPFGWPYAPFWYSSQVVVVRDRPRHDFQHGPVPQRSGDGHRHDAR